MSLTPAIALLLLLDAALFASVQPILGKLLLPIFGGTPMVWNGTLLFFQAAFFLGAGYAVVKQKIFKPRTQILFHLGLLLASLIFLPLHVAHEGWYLKFSSPFLSLGLALIVCVGLPIFMVACNSILLQTWCARSDLKFRENPYALFSISHCGMILGLILYAAVESSVGLRTLSLAWSVGFGVFSLAMTLVLSLLRRHIPEPIESLKVPVFVEQAPSWQQKGKWFAYPMISMALLLSFTNVITIDLSSFPLLWVAPMVIYSLSYVLTFANFNIPFLRLDKMFLAQTALMVPLFVALLFSGAAGTPVLFALHTGFFLVSCLICHKILSEAKPSTAHLPKFYMYMGAGNVAGAILISIVAPLVLAKPIEYGLLIVTLCLVRPFWSKLNLKDLGSWTLTAATLALTFFTLRKTGLQPDTLTTALLASLLAAVLVFLHKKNLQMATVGLFLLSLATFEIGGGYNDIFVGRSFFGPSRVMENESLRLYSNGNTLHGIQPITAEDENKPISYFHDESPFGAFMKTAMTHLPKAPMVVVGLGVGTIAAWGEKDQEMSFIEIDPLVKRIAQQHFTYLAKSPAKTDVLLGDGRAVLRGLPNQKYGVIVMDAFTSDVVPTHLLTLEAMKSYVEKLQPGGVLMIQATNRYYDFAPLLTGIAKELGMSLAHGNDYAINHGRENEGMYVSNWFAMTKNRSLLKDLVQDDLWQRVRLRDQEKSVVWTDDYANLLSLLIPASQGE